jgi:hypothetical protein
MNAEKKEEEPGGAPVERYGRAPIKLNMPQEVFDEIAAAIKTAMEKADPYSARLNAVDRIRNRGVGVKRMGFIMNAFGYAVRNPQFLPPDISISQYQKDIDNLINTNSLVVLTRQLLEYMVNLNILCGNKAYMDSLGLFSSLRRHARLHLEGSESIFRDLKAFFKNMGVRDRPQTRKEQMRDAAALIDGKRDGEMTIINVRPKVKRGRREVIIEEFATNNTNSTNERG